jgi:hypothetical protein
MTSNGALRTFLSPFLKLEARLLGLKAPSYEPHYVAEEAFVRRETILN